MSTKFVPASKDYPCPICGGHDWCFRIDDGVWQCGRKPLADLDKRWKPVAAGKDGRTIWSLSRGKWGKAREKGFAEFKPLELDPNASDWQVEALRHVLNHEQQQQQAEQPRQLQDYFSLKTLFDGRLQYNELSKSVELEGQPWEIPDAKLNLAIDYKHKTKCGDEAVARICDRIARENSYSPVRDYLTEAHRRHGGSYSLDRIVEQYLGTSNPLHSRLLTQVLVAAVARAYRPGCKVDTLPILVGNQGLGKSSFWRTLASAPWFDDSLDLDLIGDKDSRLQLHSAWIIELQEVEQLFTSKRQRGRLKGFLTTTTDRLRRPYGRSFETLSRHFVLVGSTNHAQFLDDPTGNRRFLIIPCLKQIPIERLEAERDQIWAAAVELYRGGFPWWPDREDVAALAAETSQYETTDPWLEVVEGFCEGRDWVVIAEVFGLLGVEASRQAIREAQRVGAILTRLGYVQDKNPTRTEVFVGAEGQRQQRSIKARKWRRPSAAVLANADSSNEGWVDA